MVNTTYLISHKDVQFSVSVPIENGTVITNRYCPSELVTGGMSFIKAINGESIDEFLTDCQKQVIAMAEAANESDRLNLHIGGLMAAVMDHLSHCGRLIFGDLLIYVDCFAHLLIADGFSEDEVLKIYPKITKTIVDFYPEGIKSTIDLSPFNQSSIYLILCELARR